MNPQKLQRKLQWYKMIGHPVNHEGKSVIAIVEATSRRSALRYHGGKRRQMLNGENVVVQFPTEQGAIQPLGKKLRPEREKDKSDAIVDVIPVTRYLCKCGKEHISEHPYPSMWCQCGEKAWPVHRREHL